jgi:predicted phosphodiesterase
MRVAILADIHGNMAALEQVAEQVARSRPDLVLVAGDIVNRGPRSGECLRFVRERARDSSWQFIRGNHERYVIEVDAGQRTYQGLDVAVRDSLRWTLADMGGSAAVVALPTLLRFGAPDGGEIRLVHASMRDDRDNILTTTSDEELRQKIAPAPALFCCGHTHRPLVRHIDRTLVVNAGSVGLPFDGDARASYAEATWARHAGWAAQIVRVEYDRERTARDYETSGFLAESGAAAPIIYHEFRTARPCMSRWFARYEQAVLAGELSVEQSVARILAEVAEQPEHGAAAPA